MLVPVILCGGSGTRLWPLSREHYPKQLMPLAGEKTLLQDTLDRTRGLPNLDDPFLVCNEAHRFIVAEQCRAAGVVPRAVILEPMGRNTAPAVAVAALQSQEGGSDPMLLVLPADHHISDSAAFRTAVGQGLEPARQGRLVTFGVAPTRPETGYGYIRRGGGVAGEASAALRFVEKPAVDVAQGFLESGDWLWNSGMFLFRASRYLEALERHAPTILEACRRAVEGSRADMDFLRLDPAAFADCPSDSVDYAVMEKDAEVAVVPLYAGWSDLGTFDALWALQGGGPEENVLRGDVVALDAHGCYLRAESRLLAVVGVRDLVAVETPDAVLVASRSHAQDIKALAARLRELQRVEVDDHRRVYRPWGHYESVDQGSRFQVKRITVKPGGVLSLQMHNHRAEHWVVVRGRARITRGEEVALLSEDQSTYIPLGTTHRLENPGRIPLELIEVQTGSYLGEDDIERFEDVYGRKDGS